MAFFLNFSILFFFVDKIHEKEEIQEKIEEKESV